MTAVPLRATGSSASKCERRRPREPIKDIRCRLKERALADARRRPVDYDHSFCDRSRVNANEASALRKLVDQTDRRGLKRSVDYDGSKRPLVRCAGGKLALNDGDVRAPRERFA